MATDEFEVPALFPFLEGVYLGINAIPDAYLIVDGPNCALFKCERIQGNHDWRSTLLRSSGVHRVMDTDCTAGNVALGAETTLRERMVAASRVDGCGVVLLTALSMAALTGRQYDRIAREVAPELGAPLHLLPCRSLDGDWLDGYAAVLQCLAEGMALPAVAPARERVGIVGYLCDRNEADHRANLGELRALLAELELTLASVWLSCSPCRDLAQIASAGTIISLPYGREAAHTLARRTGAEVLECALPVGLEGTRRFLAEVGAALGRQALAARAIDRGLERVVPTLEWILPHLFVNRRVALYVDAHLAHPLSELAAEMGMRIARVTCCTHERHLVPAARGLVDGTAINFGPRTTHEQAAFRELAETDGIDLVIANSAALDIVGRDRAAFVEFGFPSYSYHALHDSPFLGFAGTLHLVERMANALSAWEDLGHERRHARDPGQLPAT